MVDSHSKMRFSPNIGSKLVGVVPLAFLGILVGGAVFYNLFNPPTLLSVAAALTSGIVGWFLWWMAMTVLTQEVIVADDRLTYNVLGRRSLSIRWSEMTMEEVAGEGRFWTLKGPDGAVIVGETLEHWEELIQICQDRLAAARLVKFAK